MLNEYPLLQYPLLTNVLCILFLIFMTFVFSLPSRVLDDEATIDIDTYDVSESKTMRDCLAWKLPPTNRHQQTVHQQQTVVCLFICFISLMKKWFSSPKNCNGKLRGSAKKINISFYLEFIGHVTHPIGNRTHKTIRSSLYDLSVARQKQKNSYHIYVSTSLLPLW